MKLNQITVPSLDLDKALVFYEKMGFELIVKALPHYLRFICPDGVATFSVHLVDDLPGKNGVMVYFESDHLDELVAQLTQKEFIFDLLPTDQSWLWREARLRDPDGNLLVLYHGGENRTNPPWRVK